MDTLLVETIFKNIKRVERNEQKLYTNDFDPEFLFFTSDLMANICSILEQSNSTLFQSLSIFRRMLKYKIPDKTSIDFIIFILACVLISSKMDSITECRVSRKLIQSFFKKLIVNKIPHVKLLTDKDIDKIEKYERLICIHLDFYILNVTSIDFIDMYVNGLIVSETHDFVQLITSTLLLIEHSPEVNNYLPSQKSAGTILYSLWFFSEYKELNKSLWTINLQIKTGYVYEELEELVHKIEQIHIQRKVKWIKK